MRVSQRTGLEGALVGTGFPYRENRKWLGPYLAMLERVMNATAGVRREHNDRFGSFVTWRAGANLRALPATLLEAIYLGDHIRLLLRVGAPGFPTTEIAVKRPAGVPMAGLEPGLPAALAWQPHHARAFALDTPTPPVSRHRA